MASKLNQIIAVASGKKTKSKDAVTEVYHKLQKATLFDGISRNYHPDDEDGERFPSENKNVQYKVRNAIDEAKAAWAELFDVTATQEWANCEARADVVVGGQVLLSQVPVTYLLFLEKQCVDLQTFVTKLPTLDPAETWQWNSNADCYSSAEHRTTKSEKVMQNHIKYEATDKHPAQVETFTRDKKVGEWATVKFSGAIPQTLKNSFLGKIAQVIDAVKCAREQANSIEVKNVEVAKPLLTYLFDEIYR